MIEFPWIQAFAGLDSMQMTGENTELGTYQLGKGFVVDGAVDTRRTRKIMCLENFGVLLL